MCWGEVWAGGEDPALTEPEEDQAGQAQHQPPQSYLTQGCHYSQYAGSRSVKARGPDRPGTLAQHQPTHPDLTQVRH